MKRIITVVLLLLMLGSSASAVTLNPRTKTSDSSLQIETLTSINDLGELYPTSFELEPRLGYYRSGKRIISDMNDYYEAPEGYTFAVLRMDITNTTKNRINYLSNAWVSVSIDDKNTYDGYCFQMNYDNYTSANYQSWYGNSSCPQFHPPQISDNHRITGLHRDYQQDIQNPGYGHIHRRRRVRLISSCDRRTRFLCGNQVQ